MIDYKKLLMLIRAAVVGIGPDNTVLFANPAAEKLFGGVIEGKKATELLPAHLFGETSDSFVSSAVIGEKRVTVSAVRTVDLLLLSITVSPCYSESFSNGAQKVVASVSSSLGTLRIAADKLAERMPKGDPQCVGYAAALYHSYFSILRQTRNVSMVSSLINHSTVFTPAKTDLVEFCADLTGSAALFVDSGAASLTFSTALETLFADVDREKLEQLLLNLIANSLAHTPAEGRITLSVKRLGDNAVIAVDDTGSGIAPDILPTVFSRFNQELSLSALASGTGLGLSIARGIAELHGGALVIESRENIGTSVRVMLPIDNNSPRRFSDVITEYRSSGANSLLTELSGVISSSYYVSRYMD